MPSPNAVAIAALATAAHAAVKTAGVPAVGGLATKVLQHLTRRTAATRRHG